MSGARGTEQSEPGRGDAELIELAEQYFRAVNTEDWDLLARLWHDDADLLAVGQRPRHGTTDIADYFGKVLAGYAEHTDSPTRYLPSGGSLVVEIHFVGRTVAGRRVEFEALDVFDVEDGLIKRLQTWYDTAQVAGQVRGGPG